MATGPGGGGRFPAVAVPRAGPLPGGERFTPIEASGRIVVTLPGLPEPAPAAAPGVFTGPGGGGRLMAEVPAAVTGLPQSR